MVSKTEWLDIFVLCSCDIFVYNSLKVPNGRELCLLVRSWEYIRDLMFSKNHKAATKHYTLNDVPLQLQIEAIRDFLIGTRFDKGEVRLIVTAIDIVDGLSVTFDCSQTQTTK